MKYLSMLLLLSSLAVAEVADHEKDMPESQRFLRLSCEKNQAQACFLLARVLVEENKAKSDELFQKACNLGNCERGFQKQVVIENSFLEINSEKEYLKGGFEIDIIRKIASVDDCFDLSISISSCEPSQCRKPHPLIPDYDVIHTIVKNQDFCYYNQQLPKQKLIQCRFTEDQAQEFSGLGTLQMFTLINNLIDEKICILRPIDKSEL